MSSGARDLSPEEIEELAETVRSEGFELVADWLEELDETAGERDD